MAKFTWSGKGKGNKVTKNSFESLKLIHGLVIDALKKIDAGYNFDLFKADIVSHIAKRAYENEPKK